MIGNKQKLGNKKAGMRTKRLTKKMGVLVTLLVAGVFVAGAAIIPYLFKETTTINIDNLKDKITVEGFPIPKDQSVTYNKAVGTSWTQTNNIKSTATIPIDVTLTWTSTPDSTADCIVYFTSPENSDPNAHITTMTIPGPTLPDQDIHIITHFSIPLWTDATQIIGTITFGHA